jgi:hypothetical protein
MLQIVGAVFCANILTLCVVWGMNQFQKPEREIPWLAYAAFLLPIFIALAGLISSGALQPPADGLALR